MFLVRARDQDRRERRDGGEEQRARENVRRARIQVEGIRAVGRPGLTPGMKPPYFFRLSAWSTGLNVTAV